MTSYNQYLTYASLESFGAFGNQLFQIAGTIGEADKRGMEPLFPEWSYKKWFSFPEEYFTNNLSQHDREDMGTVYLQDLDHWWHIKERVFSYLKPSEYAEGAIQTPPFKDFTAVHVRRANNLGLPNHHPVPTLDYFEQALDILRPLNTVVFSDDLDWCRRQSIFKDSWFANGNPPSVNVMELTGARPLALDSVVTDFIEMSTCSDFILSNSTFSLWAALIADHYSSLKPRVVYPNNWYGVAIRDEVDHTLMFKHYDNWIGI